MAVKDIAGNKRAKQAMLSLAAAGRGAGSFIFTGAENTGKAYSARQFAKALNCLNPKPGADCCDACDNCRAIDRVLTEFDEDGRQLHPHTDITYITTDKATITVEDVKEPVEKFNSYTPLSLKTKILVIESCERMNDASQNAILKGLEEPGSGCAIILLCSAPDKLLPTIISRCRRFEILPAGTAEIEAALVKGGIFTPEEAKKAAEYSGGRIGDAVDFERIKENIAFAKSIFEALARKGDDVEALFNAAAGIEAAKAGKKKETDGYRIFLLDILKILSYIYKDLSLETAGVKRVVEERYGINPAMLKGYSLRKLSKIASLIETAQRDLLNNANNRVLFSTLFFNIRKAGLSDD